MLLASLARSNDQFWMGADGHPFDTANGANGAKGGNTDTYTEGVE